MTKKPSLSELLERWERSAVSPEELCRDCPELLDELRRVIASRTESEHESGSTIDPETPRPPDPEFVELLAHFSQRSTVSHRLRQGGEPRQPPTDLLFDRYRLDEKVGRGGFGEVWKAFDLQLNRVVALKAPRSDGSHSPSQIESFLAEARKAASLRHENIVRVYDVQRHGDSWLIISEFIDGKSLGSASRDANWTVRDKVQIVADVAGALHFAHQRGVVHRDVKPANILISDDGKPCLTDFGLAVTEDEQLAEPPGVCGTTKYMSPEQARGESNRTDPRTDVYSLGVLFYELLTKRTPYKANSSEEYLKQIIHKEPWPLRSLDPSIPQELERICLKCLAKSMSERYTTAGDLVEDLQRWLQESSDSTDRIPVEGTKQPSARRAISVGIGVFLIALCVGVLWTMLQKPDDDTPNSRKVETPVSDVPREKDLLKAEQPKQPDSLAWVSKLNVEPKEIIWPGHKDKGEWELSEKYGAILLSCSYLQMVQLGEILPDDDCTISMEILQPQWIGSAGIFLGYDVVEPQPGRKMATFQSFELVRSRDKQKKSVLQLRRRKVTVLPENGSIIGGWESFENLVSPSSGKPMRLTIKIVQNKLRSATWATKELNALTSPKANGLFKQKDYIGAWGVFGRVGATFFIGVEQTSHAKEKKNG